MYLVRIVYVAIGQRIIEDDLKFDNKMNIFTAVLAFLLGSYVAESISTMTPEKMIAIEKKQKDEVKK